MMPKQLRIALFFLLSNFLALPSQAEPAALKPFVSGSYKQLQDSNVNKPFMLVIWSITCSSCLKDMALLNTLHKAHPNINMVMLATDDASATEQIQEILAKNELSSLENWLFADDNAQKLRYEIDPKWYGEMPRTYFFDKNHEREGISGVLSQEDYESRFKNMLN
jgi:thiol-disulfide isomerase/thioredoxin